MKSPDLSKKGKLFVAITRSCSPTYLEYAYEAASSLNASILPLFRKVLIILGLVFLSGCATTARQTEAILKAPPNLPAAHRLENVEFLAQTENYCGPATLTMALRHSGKTAHVDEIAAQVYTPGKKGTLQQDLLGSARRQGMVAVQIQGIPSLLRELAAGNPVIVFMNLGLSWYPIYHYALVTGYNLTEPSVWMHSGKSKDKEWSMRKFERSWELGNYWGLVVLPPSRLSASGSELEHSAAAAGLEAVGKNSEAETAYATVLQQWPDSFGALVGMGNLTYARGEARRAEQFLSRVVKAHPERSAGWHNLAVAQSAIGLKDKARASALRAYELANPAEKNNYRESLKEWLPSTGINKDFLGTTLSPAQSAQ